MARNAEKAMTALARWRRMKLEEEKGPTTIRRPNRADDVTDRKLCERFRREIIMEIAKGITSIQNPGLGEYKIRDVNDEINKLLRHKQMWELRIKELGGPDYRRTAPKMLDREGKEVPGNRGYKYFGAAKDLPGVRELFERPPPDQTRKTRADLMRDIDADYYGYMDDDDGLIVPLEREAEIKARTAHVEEWKRKKEAGGETSLSTADDSDIYAIDEQADDDDESSKIVFDDQGQPKYIAHVPVPTQKDIEQALLRRKKMELLEKYASDALAQQSETARTLMGMKETKLITIS